MLACVIFSSETMTEAEDQNMYHIFLFTVEDAEKREVKFIPQDFFVVVFFSLHQ